MISCALGVSDGKAICASVGGKGIATMTLSVGLGIKFVIVSRILQDKDNMVSSANKINRILFLIFHLLIMREMLS